MSKGFTKNELTIGIPIAGIIVALVVWGIWYEFARAKDAQRYGEALIWHSAFALYFHNHGVYPSTSTDGQSLQGKCLVDVGLVAITDSACSASAYIYNVSSESSAVYYPRTSDNFVCNDHQGCSRYYMTLSQTTRAISGQPRDVFRTSPRGIHIFGPEGLLITQKQIPGL